MRPIFTSGLAPAAPLCRHPVWLKAFAYALAIVISVICLYP